MLGAGAALNMWTTRHGRLLNPHATVIQIDHDAGRDRRPSPGRPGGRRRRGRGGAGADRRGWTARVRRLRLAQSGAGRADPARRVARRRRTPMPATTRTSIRARCRPRSTDCCRWSGPWPSIRATSWATRRCTCACRTRSGFVFTQAFQAVGLGLGSAIGAAVARPDRLTVAALGDGGAHDRPGRPGDGRPTRLADADRGLQRRGVRRRGPPLRTARPPARPGALSRRGLRRARPRGRPGRGHRPQSSGRPARRSRDWLDAGAQPGMVLDAKVVPTVVAEWLEEAFRGH